MKFKIIVIYIIYKQHGRQSPQDIKVRCDLNLTPIEIELFKILPKVINSSNEITVSQYFGLLRACTDFLVDIFYGTLTEIYAEFVCHFHVRFRRFYQVEVCGNVHVFLGQMELWIRVYSEPSFKPVFGNFCGVEGDRLNNLQSFQHKI